MIWTFLIPSVLYFLLVSFVIIGIFRLSQQQKQTNLQETPLTDIIIPFRNEETRIGNLLSSLNQLNFPRNKLQIIFVNDHSEDDSVSLVKAFLLKSKFNARLEELPKELKGKKAALTKGIMHSESSFVLFTDADCTLPSNWAKGMIKYALQTDADMVLGQVSMTGKSITGKLQSAEFSSLQAITMATSGFGTPVLGNAANMAIKTNCLKSIEDPFRAEISSGDDVFLIHKLQSLKKQIRYCTQSGTLVITPASETLIQLLNQRARWLKKTKYYPVSLPLVLAIGFGILQFSYLIIIPYLILSGFWGIFAAIIVHKILMDIIAIKSTGIYNTHKQNISYIIILSLVYPFWTFFYSILTYLITPDWKGRKIMR
jgi:poly-beta-1,6-N-acetyl-D-glucosamine synthase